MKKGAFQFFLATVFISLTLGLLSPSEASMLYVTGQNNLVRYDTADGNGTTVYSGTGISGIADDPLRDDVYYRTEQYPYRHLWRDNDPGAAGPVDKLQDVSLMSNNLWFGNMDFDPSARNLFYDQSYTSYGETYTSIQMFDIDSNSVSTIYSANVRTIIGWSGYYNPRPIYAYVHDVADVAVDPLGGSIYWTDRYAGTISRFDINGTGGIEVLYSGLVNPYGIALDTGTGSLFWSEKGDSSNGYDSFIKSADINGAGSATTLLSYDGIDSSRYYGSIDVDPVTGLLYFVEFLPEYSGSYSGKVQTMDYSGQNVQDFLNASGAPVIGQLIEVSAPPVVPEPVSSLLFIVGGATLGFRRFRKRLMK